MNTDSKNNKTEQCTIPIVTSRFLTDEELKQGYIIRQGQKTTKGIENLCEESEMASKQTLNNQYF